MTAIFTGLGAGQAKSSTTALGSAGTLGNAAAGRAGEGLSVNAATGNLLISRRDEFLVGRSLDVGISRTYNSLAEVHDRDNNDKWMMSTSRRVFGLSGSLNSSGSTVKRVSGDGSVVTYRYETRSGVTSYWATDGSGAHDRMWQSGGDWYWQDGTSRITERYDADPYNGGEYRIIGQADRDNQSLVFGYSGSKLSYIKTNNGEYVRYAWSGNNLTSIRTEFKDPKTNVTRTETGTYYAYDGSGRLSTVTIDLSPEAAGTSDSHKFTISYLYDSAGRVTRMTQSDGSRTDIAYTSGKVTKLTEHVGDGTTRVTQFAYGTNYTNVTAPNGQITRLDYNSSTKLLAKITAPPSFAGAAAQVQTFTYDSAENLTQSVASDGRVTKYTYDDRGNITKVDRPIGTDVTKWYDADNNLIKELSYGSNEASSNTGSYIRYAYDSEDHLRYKVTAEGHVTEYRYDSYGRLIWEGDYTKYAYAHSSSNISESGMNSWRDGLADKTQVDWMNYRYDARGNLKETVNYGSATTSGGASTSGELYSRTYLVYDQEGRLLTRYGQSESGKEQFVYDGMGRLISSADSAGGTTSVFFDDANTRTVMQMASGLTRTLVYNKAGDVISETESSVGIHGANLAPALTSWGLSSQITRTATSSIAGQPAYLYSFPNAASYGNTNRQVGVSAGETVKFKITVMGSGSQVRHRIGLHGSSEGWGTSKDTKTQAIITNGPGRLTQDRGGLWWLDGISTTAATTIEITRTFDVAQNAGSYFYVGGSGTVAANTAVILSNPTITKTANDTSLDFSATTNNKYDKLGRLRVTQDAFDGRGANYVIYDKAGRKTGTVDPAGRLTEYFYDKNNRLIGTTTYYNAVSSTVRSQLANPDNTLEMSAIRPSLNSTYDVLELTTYDANGRVAQVINGEGEVLSFKYDNTGRIIEKRNHLNRVTIASSWRTAPPANPVSISNHSNDAVSRTFYDRDGNVRGVLDGEGYLTEYVYDQSGQKIQDIGYVTRTSSSYWSSGTLNQIRSTAGPSNSNNRSVRYVYNGRGELRFKIDSANYVTQLKYNYAGKLTTKTEHINALSSSHSNWTLAGVKAALATNSNDRTATNYYDFAGRLWRTVSPVGLDTRMYFDAAGNVTKLTEGSHVTRNWYDARGNIRFRVDAEGYLNSYLYNEGGQVTYERRHRDKVSVSDSTTIQQVAALAPTKLSQKRFTYDSQGRLIYSYDQMNNRTRFVYRTNGQLAYTNIGDGTSHSSQTYYYYDNAGRITRTDSANGQSEETITYFTYDGLGNKTQVKDGNGRIAYFTYDKRGNVITEKNGAGNQIRYERNAFGQIVKTWDAKNVLASEHIYDKRGLVTRSYDALRKITDYTYTQFGEVKTVKDPRGGITTYTYDKLSQLKSVKDANNKTESYAYDAYGNQTSMTNKLGGVTSYTYDALGRMKTKNDANGIVTAYTLDNRGNVTRMVEASGRSEARATDYTYDAANRLLTTKVEGHSRSYTTSLAYDARGNVIRKTAPDGGRTIYYYDDLDRISAQINAVGTYTAYTYDRNGNVKTVKVYASAVTVPSTGGAQEQAPAVPSGSYRETRFDYDGANRLVKSHVIGVTSRYYTGSSLATYSGTTITTQYVHDANGNIVKTIDPNGGTTWAYYDAMNRMTHQVDQQNFRTSWTYDATGNVTREVRYANATSTPTSTTNVPGVSTNSSLDRRTDYTYDSVGNRLSEKRINVKIHNGSGGHTTAHATLTFQYNGLGQVTKKTEAVSGNVTDYTYDVGGRLTKEQRAAFTDYNGNSVRPTVDYYYDGLGNLTQTRQRGATGASERKTYYYYQKGMLDRMTDAGGLTRYFRYDAGGNENEVYYTRSNYYGSSRTEGVKRTHDKLGRVTSEFQGVKSGSTWTQVSPNIITTYNAYGQVATIKAGTGSTQQNVYDKAGRLERTNSGNGVWKIYAYDRNGNQTAAVTSAGYNIGNRSFSSALGLISRSDVNITYTTYDKRGQARFVYETDRDISTTAVNQTLVTERRYNAFGEVSYEKDANGGDIYYDYNTMGKAWRVRNPSVSIQNENGSTSTVRPTEHYYHDLGGRLVASRDANGNLTRMTLLNGTGFGGSQALATSETYADGGVRTTKYDIHGDARRIIGVADGRSTTYRTIQQTFDKMGRITQTWNRGTNLQDNYTYDKVGQQISHWNNVFGSGNRAISDYDAMGRVVSSRAFGGDTTTTTYTFEVSSNTNVVGNFGGWKKVTRTVANNRTLTEWTDLFDRIKRKNDFGGHDFTFSYDAGGRMKSKIGNGGNQQYVFYNTGQMKSISNVTGVLNSDNFQELKTTYGYDKTGNLTSQKTTDRGSTYYEYDFGDYDDYGGYYEPEVYIDTWNRTTQNMSATYDQLGRMKSWSEAGGGDLPAASMTWTYDANGNIRRSRATYRRINSDQTIATSNSIQDNWYRYDNMNRVVTSRGILSGGTVKRGTNGMDIVYNKAGQRTSVITSSRQSYTYWVNTGGGGGGGGDPILQPFDPYDDIGDPYLDPYDDPYGGSSGYHNTVYYDVDKRENYSYDNGGRLREVRVSNGSFNSYAFQNAVAGGGYVNPNDYVTAASSGGSKKADYLYDAMSRLTRQQDFSGSTVVYSRNVYYNSEGLIYRDDSSTKKGSDTYRANMYNYYLADNNLNYAYTYNYKNGSGSGAPNTRTTNSYDWYDGAVQSQVDFDRDTGSSSNSIYRSTYRYDSFGTLQSAQINDGRSRSVSYITNAEGQIISRKERDNNYSKGDPREVYYRFGGKEIGRVGNNGTANINYEQSIARRTANTSNNYGAFINGADYGTSHADFGGDYNAINSFKQGEAGGTHTVRSGETLEAIAMQVWGDSSLWYKIAEANGLSGREPLIEGRVLTLPTGIQRVHHNSGTMKPYDPAEAIGDTSPTASSKPKKKKCGVFGAILLAVVAVAVTIITAGAALAAMGAVSSVSAGIATVLGTSAAVSGVGAGALIAAGAIGGAVGSIASQGLGVATGIQDKFSWKGVALSALSGAVGGAVGANGLFGEAGMFGKGWVAAAARGSVSSATVQALAVKTGLQEKFSWAGVAAAGVGAGVTSAVSNATNGLGGFTSSLISNTAGGIANAATRAALDRTNLGDALLQAIPDIIGNTIGTSLAGLASAKPVPVEDQIQLARNKTDGLKDSIYGEDIEMSPEQVEAFNRMQDLAMKAAADPENAKARRAFGAATDDFLEASRGIPKVDDYFRLIESTSSDNSSAALTQSNGPEDAPSQDVDATTKEEVTHLDEVLVHGRRDYWIGGTIDRTGIFVGEVKQTVERDIAKYVEERPGLGLALQVADTGMAVAAPGKYLAGWALDYFESEAEGFVSRRMNRNDWSSGKSDSGGDGFVFATKLLLSGFGAVLRRGRNLGGGITRQTRNGYDFDVDNMGRTTRVQGELSLRNAQRNPRAQREAGGADRLPDDHGGHFIGARFNGPGDGSNLFAQNGNFNVSAYKTLENQWARALEGGQRVTVDIRPTYSGNSLRPTRIDVNYTIGNQSFTEAFRNVRGGR